MTNKAYFWKPPYALNRLFPVNYEIKTGYRAKTVYLDLRNQNGNLNQFDEIEPFIPGYTV